MVIIAMLMVTKIMPQTHSNCKADPKSHVQHICDKTKHSTCDIRLSQFGCETSIMADDDDNIDRGNNDDYVYDEDD